MGPIGRLDSVFSSNSFGNSFSEPKEDDSLMLHIILKASDAESLMHEASRRGISYEEMALIFIKQGMFFWSGKQ